MGWILPRGYWILWRGYCDVDTEYCHVDIVTWILNIVTWILWRGYRILSRRYCHVDTDIYAKRISNITEKDIAVNHKHIPMYIYTQERGSARIHTHIKKKNLCLKSACCLTRIPHLRRHQHVSQSSVSCGIRPWKYEWENVAYVRGDPPNDWKQFGLFLKYTTTDLFLRYKATEALCV